MKKTANILFTAAFLFVLLVVSVRSLMRTGEDYTWFENRTLKSPPEVTAEGVLDGGYFKNVEAYLLDHAAFRNGLLRVSTLLDLAVKKPVIGSIAVTDERLMYFSGYGGYDEGAIESGADVMSKRLIDIAGAVEECGGHYYYVLVPTQDIYFSDKFPSYMETRRPMVEAAISALDERLAGTSVRLIDMDKVFDGLGRPPEAGTVSDHHYSMYGAYITYRTVMDAVTRDLGTELPVLREGDFDVLELPNHQIGSRARQLFDLWKGEAHIQCYIPHETVPFTRTNAGLDSYPSVYRMPQTEDESITYDVYMGGDMSETVIDTSRPELPSVLVYGDSFTNPFESLIYYSFDEMHSLDLRGYDEKTLREYIEDYRPAAVICIRSSDTAVSIGDNGRGLDELPPKKN